MSALYSGVATVVASGVFLLSAGTVVPQVLHHSVEQLFQGVGAIPEPAAYAVIGLGLVAFSMLRNRKRKASSIPD